MKNKHFISIKELSFIVVITLFLISVIMPTITFASGDVPTGEIRLKNDITFVDNYLVDDIAINNITEGDKTISGTGKPGANIIVTFDNGYKINTTIDKEGNWTIEVPDQIVLNADDTVTASYIPAEPHVFKESEKLTNSIEENYIGDTLLYTITVGNDAIGSMLYDVTITDTIPKEVDFTMTSADIQINGLQLPESDYSYDVETRKLVINLGDINDETKRIITFKVVINSNGEGENIENHAYVEGKVLDDATTAVVLPVSNYAWILIIFLILIVLIFLLALCICLKKRRKKCC